MTNVQVIEGIAQAKRLKLYNSQSGLAGELLNNPSDNKELHLLELSRSQADSRSESFERIGECFSPFFTVFV